MIDNADLDRPVEAAAIALEQQVEPPRPLTHDLIRDLIAALGIRSKRCAL